MFRYPHLACALLLVLLLSACSKLPDDQKTYLSHMEDAIDSFEDALETGNRTNIDLVITNIINPLYDSLDGKQIFDWVATVTRVDPPKTPCKQFCGPTIQARHEGLVFVLRWPSPKDSDRVLGIVDGDRIVFSGKVYRGISRYPFTEVTFTIEPHQISPI